MQIRLVHLIELSIVLASARLCLGQIVALDGRNGFDSSYNLATGADFSGLREQLTLRGITTTALSSFTSADLAGVDALVLLQPFSSSTSFAAAELVAIQTFVGSGKGLLVLGDAGGGSSDALINPIASLFGVTYSALGTDQAGHLISSFMPHSLTASLSSVGVDYQRLLTVSGDAIDLTPGSGSDDFLAVSGKAVFLSDSSLFANASAGGDYPLSFGSNSLLLDNTMSYLTAVPEPAAYGVVIGLALSFLAGVRSRRRVAQLVPHDSHLRAEP